MVVFTEKSPVRGQFTQKNASWHKTNWRILNPSFCFGRITIQILKIQIAGQNRFEADGGAPLIKIDDQASKKTQGLNERRFLFIY